jgi:glucose/arabinose dehydrogenase
MRLYRPLVAFALLALPSYAAQAQSFEIGGTSRSLMAEVVTTFDEPWAMTFLPDGSALVTTRTGKLFRVSRGGDKTEVEGVGAVAYGGQGGLGDVKLHPAFDTNGRIYLSSVEASEDGQTFGAVVTSAKLEIGVGQSRLVDKKLIWRQEPKVTGRSHFSHRLAFDQAGMLYISSGDRQKLDPAQKFATDLGKVIRINADGGVPDDNPWQDRGAAARKFWSMGHRNVLGLAFDKQGRLWAHEMGPRGGDELNLIEKGANYGWPVVSNGTHYSGAPIPDHETRPQFAAPKISWSPVISPAGFAIYDGEMFRDWRGNGFIGALTAMALVRVEIADGSAIEAERFEWGKRIREVEQGADDAIWILEDGAGARLLRLTPSD